MFVAQGRWIYRGAFLFMASLFVYAYVCVVTPSYWHDITDLQESLPYANALSEGGEAYENPLKSLLKCKKKDYSSSIRQHGDYWILTNLIRANHGELECYETITYTTHADYTFLNNLIPLLERWEAPLSVALHTPGFDFDRSIEIIRYLRDCHPQAYLIQQYATFHFYFENIHLPPKEISYYLENLEQPFDCSLNTTLNDLLAAPMYKKLFSLTYPVNVGRNVARDAALTYFILPSDIELYPSLKLVGSFLKMIATEEYRKLVNTTSVFVLPIFEVEEVVAVPENKTELQQLLKSKKAIKFHERICPYCHSVPKIDEWIKANETKEELKVFATSKREGRFRNWEPIYIGTNAEPYYDERLSWEGKSDKMTQGYALCALSYDFLVLDNAFLVHKPGIKTIAEAKRVQLEAKQRAFIAQTIRKELKMFYGDKKNCTI